MTLAELARPTGISVSTLVEAGVRPLRGRTSSCCCRSPGARVAARRPGRRAGTGDPRVQRSRSPGTDASSPLTRRPGGLQAYNWSIPAGATIAEPELQVHEGYEWLYVLSGRLRLVLGEHDLVLRAGEAAEFDTRVPHWFYRAGRSPWSSSACSGRRASACMSARACAPRRRHGGGINRNESVLKRERHLTTGKVCPSTWSLTTASGSIA